MQRIWVLNFDADDELAAPVGYTTPAAMRARFETLSERAVMLVPPGDLVLRDAALQAEVRAGGGTFSGRAFCPTPQALRALSRASVPTPRAPALDVLQRVNGRAFCADLGQTLAGARFVSSRSELGAALEGARGPWLLKRVHGFAGRGQRRLRSNEIEPAAEPFVRASLEKGGLQVEPLVDRIIDVALHGFLEINGKIHLGEPTVQRVDEHGAWLSTMPAGDELLVGERKSLFEEAQRAATALRAARYFGPFGIDAFRYRDGEGTVRWNPRSEINARYSMGWAVGMGECRPDLDDPE